MIGIDFFDNVMVRHSRSPGNNIKRHPARSPRENLLSLKNDLRKRILSLLRSQKEEDRLRKGRIIKEKLFAAEEFQKAKIILFYASFDGEVDTFEMMKHAQNLGKKIALPITLKDKKKIIPALVEDLDSVDVGAYGIRQPNIESSQILKVEDIDLAVVPGVAFDKKHNRLGRGQGYYDRFLKNIPSDVPTIGLAFDFQLIESLPHHSRRDIPVSNVIVN